MLWFDMTEREDLPAKVQNQFIWEGYGPSLEKVQLIRSQVSQGFLQPQTHTDYFNWSEG